MGEVDNNSNHPAYFVHISARFYNSSNALIDVEDGYTVYEETKPHMRNPFRIIESNTPSDYSYYVLTLDSDDSSFVNEAGASVVSYSTKDNYIFGEIRNDNAVHLKFAIVAITFYDSLGQVIDVAWSYADVTDLAPGDTTTFKVYISRSPSNIVVQARGST